MRNIAAFMGAFAIILSLAAGGGAAAGEKDTAGSPSAQGERLIPCGEVWAYLMAGEEYELSGNEPVTDLCWFAGGVGMSGALRGGRSLPARTKIPHGARTHLVIACQNPTLMYFLLDPAYPLRGTFIADVRDVSDNFDGIQIDFEGMPPECRNNFTSLIADLKNVLETKILSVALPAKMSGDGGAYDFRGIASRADRVIIMAYDEHWSGSAPGPVASIPWCERAARYAMDNIPAERIVMGIPFYGRSWQDRRNDRALKFRTTTGLLESLAVSPDRSGGDCPSFTYRDMVSVTVYYEDSVSLARKVSLYRNMGLERVAFWRISQEPREFWGMITVPGGRVADLGRSR